MRRILELCIELDRIAYETYCGLAGVTSDEDLSGVFANMAKEERQHIDWWSDLLVAWESGLVPDIVDEHDFVHKLEDVLVEVTHMRPDDLSELSSDQMLDLAARLEFYMLDPVFGELLDLMRPGSRGDVSRAYAAHVVHLVDAIEQHYSTDGLARFLARVLRRAYRDQQRLASLAIRDQLTGLLNRRGLIGHLAQWVSWSERYGRPVAAVLLDIDRFKSLNDTMGHAAGDRALVIVADTLRESTRGSDVIGRFGGDEFLVLAPETGEEDLIGLMSRIVENVRTKTLEVNEHEVALSVSVGGAWVVGPGADVEGLLAAADRSLYAAKEAGRDRAGHPVGLGDALAV